MAQPVLRQDRKAQLLRVAAELFSQYGYHNVSMNDIADVVGITGPALYRHFRNKHEILAQALMNQLAAVHEVAHQAVNSGGSPELQFERFVTDLGRLVLDHQEALLWMRERRHLTGEEQEESRRCFREIVQHVGTVIRRRSPDMAIEESEYLGWAVLSLYANSRNFRFGLDPAAAARFLSSVAVALVDTALGSVRSTAAERVPVVPRKPAGRRERVVSAAATLFYEQGYQAVGIEDIAAASDSAIATVYQHFAGKVDVLAAVLQRGAEGLHYMTAHLLAHSQTPAEALDVLVRSYVELALGPHRRLLGVLAADLVYLPAEAQAVIRKSEREYLEEWVVALCAARPELTPMEARARAQIVIGLVTDLVRIVRVRNRPAIEAELRLLADAVLASGPSSSSPDLRLCR
jgi:AcrR family transcriptional regulator